MKTYELLKPNDNYPVPCGQYGNKNLNITQVENGFIITANGKSVVTKTHSEAIIVINQFFIKEQK